MPDDRTHQVALTEAAFRIANERMSDWSERHAGGERELYLCECGVQPCRKRVPLTREEYESVRSDARHFLTVPGHAIPDLETVVQVFPEYEVIEKPTALLDLLTETDPRDARSGEATGRAQELADDLGEAATGG
ncbi:hypothetical protein [Candidatus Solirubrobacter pratensis]|uniref:hypothetical protein n=1 Tax=Candidatus Solirubrobacter pratensis TaxID=1298857 RepID=UPI000402FBA7|nr:hypothetical protein [Candidatus Solirubrobacter pratensis]